MPAVSASLAAGAAIIAAWNARKSARNSDRQHSLSYASDVSKWASEVLTILPRTVLLYNAMDIRQDRRNTGVSIGNELIRLHDISAFLFPKASDKAPKILLEVINSVEFDTATLLDKDLDNVGQKYLDYRAGFVNAVRDSIGVQKRHSDSQKYLT
jgi:hypothetical protein